ncbi:sperm axonemal maintenance protein CFAP97D1-like [Clupea harengus]|uniref:Sperm axonemal maintenance protein CFAP97D1-like n=1 Tax=Clupea harengus TaxID=7950 RepID=A0A6P8F101_CLUHA|nr:sperm axonemal maintenance protein CFAP97D1-like [Clupea harengus]
MCIHTHAWPAAIHHFDGYVQRYKQVQGTNSENIVFYRVLYYTAHKRPPPFMAVVLQLQEDKLTIIEKDNHLLSSRLADIMQSKGLVDHRNHYSEHSLNTERRREELFQVACENQGILQRISECKSDYRRQRWEEDWKKTEHQRDDIARYPRK